MNTKRKNKTDLFNPYLSDSEDILWLGKPSPRQLLARNDWFLIPFSLMWGGFAIFWEAGAMTSGSPFFFKLWGIPFVLVGQYLIWGRFVYRYFKRKHTFYAITTHRVLILSRLFSSHFDSYQLDQLPSLTWQGRNLLFGPPVSMFARNTGFQSWHGELQPGLYGLTDVESVYHLLQNLINP